MKYLSYAILILFFSNCSAPNNNTDFTGKTIEIKTKDGITITADIYETSKEAPYILLFHQANFSRGEYREIAPKLNKMGFNCIAIDQRSGKAVNGVTNETHLNAKKQHKKTKYPDALTDLETTLEYAQNTLKAKKIILWGSSYSAALVLYLASQNKVAGVLSFSPGEYFTLKSKKIQDYASQINCPVFITSSKSEEKDWKSIYNEINADKIFFLPKTAGFHGSKALWESKKGHQEYWKAVKSFLEQFKN